MYVQGIVLNKTIFKWRYLSDDKTKQWIKIGSYM